MLFLLLYYMATYKFQLNFYLNHFCFLEVHCLCLPTLFTTSGHKTQLLKIIFLNISCTKQMHSRFKNLTWVHKDYRKDNTHFVHVPDKVFRESVLLHKSKEILTQYATQQKDGLKAILSPRAVIPV